MGLTNIFFGLAIAQWSLFHYSAESNRVLREYNIPSQDNDKAFRLINGWEAEKDRFKYFALSDDKSCGGFLIADKIVLTAAHCKGHFKNGVYIGVTNKNELNDAEYIRVDEEINYPNYDDWTYEGDFMIVVLERKSKFKPLCISNKDHEIIPGKVLYAIGVGKKEDGSYSNKLREVDVSYISNDECKKSYINYEVSDDMLCCDSREEKDACQGDSGGPLLIKGKSSENDVAVGIVSWGINCATHPGVYSRISKKYDWILETVEKNGGFLATCNKVTESPTQSPTQSSSKSLSRPCNLSAESTKEICKWASKDTADRCKRCSVKASCPRTCGLCSESSPLSCQDNIGKTITTSRGKTTGFCQRISGANIIRFCRYCSVQLNCPETCGLCSDLNGTDLPSVSNGNNSSEDNEYFTKRSFSGNDLDGDDVPSKGDSTDSNDNPEYLSSSMNHESFSAKNYDWV